MISRSFISVPMWLRGLLAFGVLSAATTLSFVPARAFDSRPIPAPVPPKVGSGRTPSCAPMRSQAYQPQVLRKVLHEVGRSRAATPVVIFDLDDTLFHVAPRQKRIFDEFFAIPANAKAFRAEAGKLGRMPWQEHCYSWKDSLVKAGLADNPAFSASFTAFWTRRFMSDAYVATDVPVAGAVAYVRSLHAAGAKLVYLTARPFPMSGRGTLAGLGNAGFPLPDARDQRSPIVLMRQLPGSAEREPSSDVAFKKMMAAKLVADGNKVVATFENEPGNLNGMLEVLPGAIGVFVDTRHSFKHGLPNPAAVWVPDYR